MSATFRTWLAASLLALSAVVLTLGSNPVGLGQRIGLALLVVFAHAWVVAVGERACVHHGGLRVTRFPIAPRLVASTPGPFPQLVLMVVLLGFVTDSLLVAGVAFGIVCILTVDLLRRVSPLILAVGALLHALATMPEFHTLGDLLETMKGWVMALVWLVLVAALFSGPVLRTDASPPYRRIAVVPVVLGGLFTYVGGLWLVTRTTVFALPKLAPWGADVFALSLAVLAGGMVQSLVLGVGAKSSGLFERDPLKIPLVSGHRVGEAMVAMAMPIVALVLISHAPLGVAGEVASRSAWAGLFGGLLIVPLVPAAALVAASLDRVDSRGSGRLCTLVSLGMLGAWFALGPEALRLFHGPDGPADALRRLTGVGLNTAPFASPDTDASRLVLFGLPAAELSRTVTLMTAACAALAARLVRRAPDQGRAFGAFAWVLVLALQVGASWVLMPRFGVSGAALGAALAAGAAFAWCAVAQVVRKVEPDPRGTGETVLAEMAEARAAERAEQAALEQRALH